MAYRSKIDSELENEIRQETLRNPPTDKLEMVRDQIRYIRDLDLRIQNAEEVVKSLQREKHELEFSTLPTLFMENKITAISLEAEGNMPAYEAKINDYYRANIKSDWPQDRKQKAFDWLERHKLADIVKTIFTIEIGRGNAKLTKKIITWLRAQKIPHSKAQAVAWNTLTMAVKERYRDHKPLKDTELEIIGATVGKIVKLQPKRGD